MNIRNIIKIILSILSTFIIFYFTNVGNITKSSINDGDYCNESTFIGKLINHKPGYVCTLGVILGKIMIPICLIQIYYIYINKYSKIRLVNIILLLIGFLLSFMNTNLQNKIKWAFILQLFIIII